MPIQYSSNSVLQRSSALYASSTQLLPLARYSVSMGNTSSSHKISAQDRAILDMKLQRDKLQQYQKRITVLTDRETAVAKTCLSKGQKSKALLALRRKRYQESLLAKTDLQLEQLQQLTSDVEFASVQKDILYGLKQGTLVLRQIHAEMGGIDNVEKLLADNADARAYQNEVSDLLRGQLTNEDEDAVEDELEALERESGTLSNPQLPRLPPVPASDVVDQEALHRDELRRAKARAQARERAERRVAEAI